MSKNEVVEKAGVLGNLFSYDGTFNRMNYLVYGLIIPISFAVIGFVLPVSLEGKFYSGGIGIALIIFVIPILVAATVKRAKDRKESPGVMVIGSFIPYIGFLIMLYLLLAPTKKEDRVVSKSSKTISIVLLVGAIGILLFILAKNAMPA